MINALRRSVTSLVSVRFWDSRISVTRLIAPTRSEGPPGLVGDAADDGGSQDRAQHQHQDQLGLDAEAVERFIRWTPCPAAPREPVAGLSPFRGVRHGFPSSAVRPRRFTARKRPRSRPAAAVAIGTEEECCYERFPSRSANRPSWSTMESMAADAEDSFDETVDVIVAGSGGRLAGAYGCPGRPVGGSAGIDRQVRRDDGLFRWRRNVVSVQCGAAPGRSGRHDRGGAEGISRAVVGERTPADLQETYVRGGTALIDYLEADPAFEFAVLPWRITSARHRSLASTGCATSSRPLPGERLGPAAALVRGPLDNDRLGAPARTCSSAGGR